jgi:hypothetical protein
MQRQGRLLAPEPEFAVRLAGRHKIDAALHAKASNNAWCFAGTQTSDEVQHMVRMVSLTAAVALLAAAPTWAQDKETKAYKFAVGLPSMQGVHSIIDGDRGGKVWFRNPVTIVEIAYDPAKEVVRVEPNNWRLPGRDQLRGRLAVERGNKILFIFEVINHFDVVGQPEGRDQRFPDGEKKPFNLEVTVYFKNR